CAPVRSGGLFGAGDLGSLGRHRIPASSGGRNPAGGGERGGRRHSGEPGHVGGRDRAGGRDAHPARTWRGPSRRPAGNMAAGRSGVRGEDRGSSGAGGRRTTRNSTKGSGCLVNNGKDRTALVAGGAGFIGSNLCEALLAQGATVICLDSYHTGRRDNLRHLAGEPRFDLVEADVIDTLPPRINGGRVRFTHIFNLACVASPPLYQADPEHTMLTNVVGTRNLLRLAEATGARFLLSSTSEVYGDPEVHPQQESYHGQVNCTGPRACYDEGKRAA